LQYLPQSYQLLTKTAGDASKLLQQEMMMNAIIDGSRNKLDELGSGLNYATAKALIQQEASNRTMGEVSLRLLPIMKAVIEALCYASFIFVMMLSLMPQGYRVLLNYAGVLMWLQIWAPLYAVLNLFMTLYGQYRSSSLIGNAGLTLMNSAGLSHINAHMASQAGWLSWSLPFIAYGIMKGGVGSFMHIAGSVTSSAQGAVGSAAGEAASGNLSLGNVSVGTTEYQNMTAFQRNTAPSSRDGQFEQLLDDGTVRMSQADGSQIFKSNISALRIRANSSENFAERAEEQIFHQNALLQSQSEEYSVARMEAARQVLNLANSSARGQSSSEGYDQSTAFGRNTAVSQALKFSKTLQDQYGFSEKQAADLTASIMAGTPKWLGVSADGSSSAGREKTAQDIQNLANEMGITNSLDESIRNMKDSKFSDSHSREARFAQDIGHTMERAENTREAMSKTQQAIDSYSKLQSFSKTGAFNIDRDESQELLEFTANQTLQGRRIGIDGAYRLLNIGGYQADAIVSAFREQKWEGIKSQIDSGLSIKTEEDINALYRNASLPGKAVHSHVDQAVGKISGETLTQQAIISGIN
jgi:conjugal transfer mating pair stabilization protein TraG